MDFSAINWIGSLVAAVVAFVIGAVWYAPPVFGKAWQRALGMSDEEIAQAHMGRIFGLSFVAMLVAALGFSLLLGPAPTVMMGIHWGLVIGIVFVATSLAIHNLFERRPLYYWLINSGFNLIQFLVYGIVLGLWP